MEESHSLEANSHSASQKFLCLVKNPKVHYHVQKSKPLVLVCNIS